MRKITILDGGMSRELMRLNAPFRQPEWSALALYEKPEAVQQVHEDFIRSGAAVITTNSYALVPFHIGEQRFRASAETMAALAGQLARQAVRNVAVKREAQGKSAVENAAVSVKIAGCIPPLFGSYRPDLFQPERVKTLAQPLIDGLAPHVDFWLCETQSAIIEPQSIKPLLPDDRPLWVSFTLKDDEPTPVPCLRSGETVQSAVEKMIELGVAAILFNCCQPEVIGAAIATTAQTLQACGAEQIQIGAYANAFAPQPEDATANEGLDEVRADLDPPAYYRWATQWVAAGASIVGGCCGIGREHIAYLAEHLK